MQLDLPSIVSQLVTACCVRLCRASMKHSRTHLPQTHAADTAQKCFLTQENVCMLTGQTAFTLLSRRCHASHGSGRGHRPSRWGGSGPRPRTCRNHRASRPQPCLVLHALMLFKLRDNLRRHISQLMLSMCKVASVSEMTPALLPSAVAELGVRMVACGRVKVEAAEKRSRKAYLTQSLVLWKIEPFKDPGRLLLSSIASGSN